MIDWKQKHTATYDNWSFVTDLYPNFRTSGSVSIAKMSGYPRIRYGITAEAWSGRYPYFNKILDRTVTLNTYAGAKKKAKEFREQIEKIRNKKGR